jgi:hypothetical protein
MVRKLLALGAATLLLGVAACSQSDDDPTNPGTTAGAEGGSDGAAGDEAAGEEGTADATGDAAGEDEAAGAEGEAADRPDEEVLGTSTAELPADPNDPTLVPLRLDVVGLERLDGLIELRVRLTNEGGSGTPDYQPYGAFDDPRLAGGEGAYSLSGASLVDGDAKKAYLTIIDSEGTCLCSTQMDTVSVAPGDSVSLYADLGGVPDDVDEIDVQVPGFATVASVPIGG